MQLRKEDVLEITENPSIGKEGQLIITIQGTANLRHFQQRGDVTVITIAPQELPRRG